MKRLFWAALAICIVVVAIAYANRRQTLAVSAGPPEATAPAGQTGSEIAVIETANGSQSGAVSSVQTPEQISAVVPTPVPVDPGPRKTAELDRTITSRAVDVLVSPQAAYEQKRAAWKQLRESGKLDQAIAELEQRVGADPRSADNAAALGHAYLQKCGTIQDLREQGILAMQADKVFDTALILDPSNWEARFTKAVALSYWPATMNKGQEVIEHFQTLIQQQESQTPQPQFADTYLWLGNQYEKDGRTDDARMTWERGALLFPDNDSLKKKLSAAQ